MKGPDWTWADLIEERNAWVAHNFSDPSGARTPLDSVLGVAEEIGELTHAALKEAQSIRGDTAKHVADAQDAVGDATIYLLGVMSFFNVEPRVSYQPELAEKFSTEPDMILLRLHTCMGDLSHVLLSGATALTVEGTVNRLVYFLELYCKARGWDYDDIVLTTWAAVAKRDWIQYPDTGLPLPV